MQWILKLASAELGLTQYSMSGQPSRSAGVQDSWQFTGSDGRGFRLTLDEHAQLWVLDVDAGIDRASVRSILDRAGENARNLDYGGDVWYASELVSEEPDIVGRAAQFARVLGDQVRIDGERRLSDRVLLNFTVDSSDQPPIFVPRTRISVGICVQGPGSGPLSAKLAAGVLEATRLICTFALGRPVAPPIAGPIPASVSGRLQGFVDKRSDASILTLARDSTSLDLFGELPLIGGFDAMQKIRGSLVAYDAAIQQSNTDVATILFVSGMEALAVPNAPWKLDRPVARFVNAVLDLCPGAVDDALAHANMEAGFSFTPRGSISRRRRELISQIYNLRSAPVHSGPAMFALSPMTAVGSPGSMRVAILSELHRKMLLEYIRAPRSFLIGHPLIYPAANSQGAESTA
ncbi:MULTISPECIES: hypothetical protein [unclassified Kribbella]|uniref:hypothetical protein n=1 Tax=unclassified Kribbella TaxID=2644121 RepID=UPI00301993E1